MAVCLICFQLNYIVISLLSRGSDTHWLFLLHVYPTATTDDDPLGLTTDVNFTHHVRRDLYMPSVYS